MNIQTKEIFESTYLIFFFFVYIMTHTIFYSFNNARRVTRNYNYEVYGIKMCTNCTQKENRRETVQCTYRYMYVCVPAG